jgi:hypothetical protein
MWKGGEDGRINTGGEGRRDLVNVLIEADRTLEKRLKINT